MSSNQSGLKSERLWPPQEQREETEVWKWDLVHQEFSSTVPASHRFVKMHPFDFDMGVQFFYQDIFTTSIQLMLHWMYKTNGTTIIPKSLHSCSDPAVGIHHTRLGNSLLHIPQREYHQHMTRAPLTLGHLARCLPLQPLPTENAYVYVHVSWTATFNTLRYPQTERKTESGRSKIWKKEWWGHENMLVSSGYATYEMKWFMGKFFVLKGTTPFLPSLLCQPLHHPSTQGSSLFISKQRHLVLLNFQLSTGLGRCLLPNKVTKQHLEHWI